MILSRAVVTLHAYSPLAITARKKHKTVFVVSISGPPPASGFPDRDWLTTRGGSIRILYTYVTFSGDIRYDNRSYAVVVYERAVADGRFRHHLFQAVFM